MFLVSYFVVRHRKRVLLSTPKYQEYARLVDMLQVHELIVEIKRKATK